MTRAFILLVICCCPILLFGQNNECFVPVEVSIPFGKKTNLVESTDQETDANMNQIYFLDSDEYSFWYKLRAKHKTEVTIDMFSTNLKDTHDILIFKYNDTSFCADVVYGDYPAHNYGKSNFEKGELQKLSFGKMAMEANVNYYISVLAYDDFDCGHILRIKHKKNVLKINAIHRSCFTFVADELLNPKGKPKEVKVEELSPEIEISGHLKSNKGAEQIPGTILFHDLSSGEHFEVKVSMNKGYRVQLKRNSKYAVRGISKYHSNTDTINTFATSGVFDLTLTKLGKGDAIIFNNIYFYPNIFKIKSGSTEGLNELLTFMKENENFEIEVQGHTAGNTPVKRYDPRYANKGKDWQFKGSAQKLSKLRATEVKLFLIENGIQNNRIKAVGYGASKKLYPEPESEEENRLNMRVEILILSD
ncbi:MAG: OmpA family protein [Flavobacteriales bacterium]|nr:OmpA family protein [Flavobacteriales bacterium]